MEKFSCGRKDLNNIRVDTRLNFSCCFHSWSRNPSRLELMGVVKIKIKTCSFMRLLSASFQRGSFYADTTKLQLLRVLLAVWTTVSLSYEPKINGSFFIYFLHQENK